MLVLITQLLQSSFVIPWLWLIMLLLFFAKSFFPTNHAFLSFHTFRQFRITFHNMTGIGFWIASQRHLNGATL